MHTRAHIAGTDATQLVVLVPCCAVLLRARVHTHIHTHHCRALQAVGTCLKGFAMQGKFSNLRRNYTNMWRQLADGLNDIKDPKVGGRVCVCCVCVCVTVCA